MIVTEDEKLAYIDLGMMGILNQDFKEELAELLFIDRSTLCKYENGTRDIPSAVLITIADFFQVSTDYLLCHNSYSDDSIDEMAISIKQMVYTLDREQLYEIRGYINAITKNKTAI